jgi:hypothetical protein
VIVSTTREIIWRTERSRCGDPSGPRKYFCATMFVAVADQKTGNSTSRCSKAGPSLPGMTASRTSHSTSSYGSTPGVVLRRVMPIARSVSSGTCGSSFEIAAVVSVVAKGPSPPL